MQPKPVEELAQPIGSEFAEDLFVPGRSRERTQQTRSQKWAMWRKFASAPHPKLELELSAAELRELQREGDTLAAVQQATEGHPCSAGVGFFQRMG